MQKLRAKTHVRLANLEHCQVDEPKSERIHEGIPIAIAVVVTSTRRALGLAAETVREIGTLVVVFAPLESAFSEHPLNVRLLVAVLVTSLALIACAMLVEASD
jgi:hypothetical protein